MKKQIRYLLTILLLAYVITGCRPLKTASKQFSKEKKIDVAYGTFPTSKMDVYLPANRSPETPFVILIHGGAWVMGVKEWETTTQDSLLAHGIASVSINYRFADDTQVHYQQLLTDIDSAINYCIAQAQEWNTRKENFITGGTSAGGHLALLYGYTTTKKISAIIANCPPTDLADTALLNYESRIGILPSIEKMTGYKYVPGHPLPPAFFASSPVHRTKNIPTLMMHGTADQTVPFSQSKKLESQLLSKNIPHNLITIPGADHDLGMHDPKVRALVYKEIITWIKQFGK